MTASKRVVEGDAARTKSRPDRGSERSCQSLDLQLRRQDRAVAALADRASLPCRAWLSNSVGSSRLLSSPYPTQRPPSPRALSRHDASSRIVAPMTCRGLESRRAEQDRRVLCRRLDLVCDWIEVGSGGAPQSGRVVEVRPGQGGRIRLAGVDDQLAAVLDRAGVLTSDSSLLRVTIKALLAEGVGFEPTETRRPQRLSRPSHSSTLASFRRRRLAVARAAPASGEELHEQPPARAPPRHRRSPASGG